MQFEIRDNGGVAWRAELEPKEVHIHSEEGKHLQSLPTEATFIPVGEGYPYAMGLPEPAEGVFLYSPSDEGNSLLLRDPEGSYVYVGPSILRFQMDETVEEYRSPIGNSGVPYPWAHTKSFTYFFGMSRIDRVPRIQEEDVPGTFFVLYGHKKTHRVPAEVLFQRP